MLSTYDNILLCLKDGRLLVSVDQLSKAGWIYSPVVATGMNPVCLSWSIKWMQTHKDLKFFNAKLINELPMVSLFFYNASNTSQRDFVLLNWILPFDWVKTLIRACWPCRDLSLRRLSQYLLEILPCRSIDPQGAVLTSYWPVAWGAVLSKGLPVSQKLEAL